MLSAPFCLLAGPVVSKHVLWLGTSAGAALPYSILAEAAARASRVLALTLLQLLLKKYGDEWTVTFPAALFRRPTLSVYPFCSLCISLCI